ncbi:integrase, partial [Acinetobacter junii]|nr:integrase [Acinetobacter junii]
SRKTRQISVSQKRDSLPTFDELECLTKYFVRKWNQSSYSYPMHLIMWFAIFSCRREAEITRMQLDDYDETDILWKIRDLKNSNGSKGNHNEFSVHDDCQQ